MACQTGPGPSCRLTHSPNFDSQSMYYTEMYLVPYQLFILILQLAIHIVSSITFTGVMKITGNFKSGI